MEPSLWGIRGGKSGEADELFKKGDCVAIGWAQMGDLSKLPADREAFKQKIQKAFPGRKKGAVPVLAGQLYRFVHEIKLEDYILYPSKLDRLIHFGKVVGPYQYDPSDGADYPNRRSVKWLKALPKTRFTQGALFEINSAMSLFLVQNYADEFLAALEGKAPTPSR